MASEYAVYIRVPVITPDGLISTAQSLVQPYVDDMRVQAQIVAVVPAAPGNEISFRHKDNGGNNGST